MSFEALILIAIGLSLDSFAVTISQGGLIKEDKLKFALKVSLIFGIFHIIMPLTGYFAGISIRDYIEAFDHWIAFIILSFIGIKMIIDDLRNHDGDSVKKIFCNNKLLIISALATSIDALAVGISFSLLDIPLLMSVLIIGSSAFIFSFTGVWFGVFLAKFSKLKMQILGGIILIYIGIKILIDHLA